MKMGASISDCGQYRYSLWRSWDESKPKVLFVMLNGSTADAEQDDPTLRRCIGFAKTWGYGRLEVVNLFGYRTLSPAILKKAHDPVGPDNDRYILNAIKDADLIVCAWGANGTYRKQDQYVERLIRNNTTKDLHYLELTMKRIPKHPLYLRGDLKPKVWGA